VQLIFTRRESLPTPENHVHESVDPRQSGQPGEGRYPITNPKRSDVLPCKERAVAADLLKLLDDRRTV